MTRATVAIFGSSATERESQDWAIADRVGERCAQAGFDVITGGYGGVMEAASEGASRAGGHTIGVVVPQLFAGRGTANQFVAETIEASSLTERIGLMIDRACGSIVLPGSIGTATELFTAWNLNHIAGRNGGERFPTVAIGKTWPLLAQILAATGASTRDVELAEDVEQAVDWFFAQPEVLAQMASTL